MQNAIYPTLKTTSPWIDKSSLLGL